MTTIEQAKSEDISTIVEIDKQTFGNQGVSREMLKSQLDVFPEGMFVAKKNGEILGIICCERHDTEEFPPYDHDVSKTHSINGKLLYLSIITVAEKFRNMGGGSLLLDKILALGNKSGIQKIYLPVNKKHPYWEKGVLRFWEKNGYKIAGETQWKISKDKIIDSYILQKNYAKS